MKTFLTSWAFLLLSIGAVAAPEVEFLPNNDPLDAIHFTADIKSLNKPNPGVTELSMTLIFDDFVVDKEPLVRVETSTEAFRVRQTTPYLNASVNFEVNLSEVREAINTILERVGDRARGGTFNFLLTHTSTAKDTPNMPLMRPQVIDIEEFSDVLANKVTAKPFLSVFSLFDGGERQIDPEDFKRATLLLGYNIRFLRTYLRGTN